VTRSVTLDGPISATAILAETAEELVRMVLADYPHEKVISLLAISVSHLEQHSDLHAAQYVAVVVRYRLEQRDVGQLHVGQLAIPRDEAYARNVEHAAMRACDCSMV
jgi:hypothetical protein